MRIAVFGAGAVGSLMAARLALAGYDVAVFARGAHGDAIAQNGLLLRDPDGERRAKVRRITTAAEAGPIDAILVTTKGHHHTDAARAIAPLLTGDQPVVFAVNGIPWWYGLNVTLAGVDPAADPARLAMDPSGEIGRIVDKRVVGAVISSPNTIEAPGVVANRTEQNALVLGAVYAEFTPRLAPLAQALRGAGIDPGQGAPIRNEIWRKLMYTMCMGPIACLTGLRNGQIRTDPGLIAILDRMSAEGVALARAHGCDPPDKIVIPATGAIVNHKQSMAQDLERGRPVEFMPVVGLPRAYAHAAGIPCPTLDLLATLLEGRLRGAGIA
jgi:2-dehydropantoate 2-reductase